MKKTIKVILAWMCCVLLTSCAGNVDYTEKAKIASEDTAIATGDDVSSDQETEASEVAEMEDGAVSVSESTMQEEREELPEEAPGYTYSDLNQIMYVQQSVNVRSLPVIEGMKISTLSYGQEVKVTGQCNETGWYRIDYEGREAFVSDAYLTVEKPVVEKAQQEQKPAAENVQQEQRPVVENVQQEQTPVDNSSDIASANSNPSSYEEHESGGTSVTIPEAEETEGNLVWVPVHGGTKYHSTSSCSNMKDPMQVTQETAIANGYEPCKRCH